MIKLLFLLVSVLFAQIPVYVDSSVKVELPKQYVIKPLEDMGDKNFIAIISQQYIPIALDNGWYFVSGIGEKKSIIVTHKPIYQINTVANVDLPSRIFFKSFKNVRFVEGDWDDFKSGRIDAIVMNKKMYADNAYYYDLKKVGIAFNKYYIVADKEFLKKHKDDAQFLSSYFPKVKLNSSIFISGLYFNKQPHISSLYNDLFKDTVAKKLKVVVTNSWPPFEFYKDGKLNGIGIDFFRLVAKKAGLNYKFLVFPSWIGIVENIKRGVFDITPNTALTNDKIKSALFSKPYMSFPLAIACKKGQKIEKIENIKSLAVGLGYSAYSLMRAYYPNLKYVFAKNVKEAFKQVENDKAQCVVDILPTIVWLINERFKDEIKIYFKTPFTFDLRIMLRKGLEAELNKINAAIDKIPRAQKNKLISKYIGDEYIMQKKYTFFIELLMLVLGIVIMIFFFVFIRGRRYKAKAEHDRLTGAYNRGAAEEKLSEIVAHHDGSLIFLDIDHFKKINDTYGHDKGDEVLKQVAKIIMENIRDEDVFGRWGGEEFIIVMPNQNYANGFFIAERLRKEIEDSDFGGIKVTVSLGVSGFKKGDNYEEIVKKADDSLYKAKKGGRNRVVGYKEH
ncbi:MAG: diguanylate cyclase [Epsilonproteobacteria bacterium]|nr:diguanylate cyclase [Campylobacterota bacterium]